MPSGTFEFAAVKYHLTYKTHLDYDEVKAKLEENSRKLVALSVVHEEGDPDEKDATPYEHTHVAVMFSKKVVSTNARLFDVGDVHPHIKTRKSVKWFKYLFEMYHQGHKVKKNGKKYFKSPVKLFDQITPASWDGDRIVFDEVVSAETTLDAFQVAEVTVKSIADVLAVRRECSRKRKHVHEWDEAADKKRFKTIEWDRKKALVLLGPSQCGKTSWACAQFNNPVLVGELNELRNFNWDGVDGIVFDEADFSNFKRKTQIYMLDMVYTRSIKVNDFMITIPKGMPRIFCNNQPCFKDLDEIKNRYVPDDTRGQAKDGKPGFFYFNDATQNPSPEAEH